MNLKFNFNGQVRRLRSTRSRRLNSALSFVLLTTKDAWRVGIHFGADTVDSYNEQEGDDPEPRVIRTHWIEKATGTLLQSHTALAAFTNPTDGYWVKHR